MSVGSGFIPTVLAACVIPNVAHFVKWPAKLLQMRLAKNNALTQRQLNQAYEGPEVDLSTRYGQMLNAVLATLRADAKFTRLHTERERARERERTRAP